MQEIGRIRLNFYEGVLVGEVRMWQKTKLIRIPTTRPLHIHILIALIIAHQSKNKT